MNTIDTTILLELYNELQKNAFIDDNGTVKDITGGNMNDLSLPSGIYKGNNITPSPEATRYYYILRMKHTVDTCYEMWFRQSPTNYNQAYIRCYDVGGWQPFKPLMPLDTVQKKLASEQKLAASDYYKVNTLTYTALRDGQVRVNGQAAFGNLTATATSARSVFLRVAINGVWSSSENYFNYGYATSAGVVISGSKVFDVKKGDTLDIYAYATGGGTLAANWTFAEFTEI